MYSQYMIASAKIIGRCGSQWLPATLNYEAKSLGQVGQHISNPWKKYLTSPTKFFDPQTKIFPLQRVAELAKLCMLMMKSAILKAHITLYIFSSINNCGLKICRLCSSLDRTDPLLNNNLSQCLNNDYTK